jgi:hypothetical protein
MIMTTTANPSANDEQPTGCPSPAPLTAEELDHVAAAGSKPSVAGGGIDPPRPVPK